ncbi:MAG TPA: transglycosylase domain-containing protein [Acidimicrobiales bacterium]|nr:transglycosylase domain-containing protein [Acidimicrobiales bacterium]
MRAFLKLVFRTAGVVIISTLAVPVTVLAVILGSLIFLPLPASLPEPKPLEAGQVTHVYDQNGQEIGQFREFEQNIPVKATDIPLVLKQAVIASEDKSFYSHGGVDVRGSVRALWADIRGKGIEQGGSTITQQYVKGAYVGKERTIVRKVREAIIASQLERQMKKDDILYKYLSSVYLGGGAYGVGAAAKVYFNKSVRDLTLTEAALLAGVIPSPSRYYPQDGPANVQLAEVRRKTVLEKMLQQGYIDKPTYDVAITQEVNAIDLQHPFDINKTNVWPKATTSFGPYPYFMDYVRKYLDAKYGAAAIDRGGLRVQTTLDPATQDAAQAAVTDALKGTKSPIGYQVQVKQPDGSMKTETRETPLEMGLVAVEPQTGFVKAMVGGRDYNESKVNLALGGCYKPTDPKIRVEVEATCWPLDAEGKYVKGGGTGRQPGSSFKPFVLATAFSKGVQPTKVYSAPSTYHIPNCTGANCTIGNYEGEGGGSADLRHATWSSINTVYAQLIRDVGCKDTAEMAKKLGVTSAWYSPDFHTCSGTYALGVIDVSPLEMASAYSSFAARGMHQDPTPIVRIEKPDGTVLEDNRSRQANRVLDEVVADNVTDVLRGVITSGTGRRADIGRPAAGKTGTSENSENNWFVGFTPTLSTAVWLGYRDQPIHMPSMKGCGAMVGGCLPAQTWHNFMAAALKDVPVTDFNQPAPIQVIKDQLNKVARTGIDPGAQRRPSGTGDGGPYVVSPPAPRAEAPTTTTTSTTEPTATSTTSTTSTTTRVLPTG